ncbi:nicotinamidase-related amidase [Anaerosolibacter carboniphilus]|uniref:Nicotinamidase-related amidase n=1 Tax=Anaerosolibacter carboniphilus TaxID=1417629 RepID=A0A841KUL8_9FIRM|nr:cysteine hydrolase [Anaerosolibacter carboniphilus]MBB6217053.1 nicotinamidase-related amidase [Anaerosolibacter carboniphilus]
MGWALIIIDMQEDFFEEGGVLSQKRNILTKNINDLSSFCRGKDIPVIWVRQEFHEDLHDAFLIMRKRRIQKTIKGTIGCQILEGLKKEPEDIEVLKKRYSAFFRTELDEILDNMNINKIIIAGINTHACVRMTTIDAYQRDMEIILAVDCINSYDENFHKDSLRYLSGYIAEILDNKDVIHRINQI